METVAFYSYKGGVGRTLLVANTAQFLAMSGRHVVALDLDLEAPGLHQKLGSPKVMERAKAGTLRGAVDELLDILENAPGERKPIAFEEVNLPFASTGSLRLIPAGAAPSHSYWTALDRLDNVMRSRSREVGLPVAVLEMQARIEAELKLRVGEQLKDVDYLLIDSRTGITELGGLATSLLADRVVCLTTTAPESVEGTKVVADALRKAPRLKSQQPLRIDCLFTRVVNESSFHASGIDKKLEAVADSVDWLPHDDDLANEELTYFKYLMADAAIQGAARALATEQKELELPAFESTAFEELCRELIKHHKVIGQTFFHIRGFLEWIHAYLQTRRPKRLSATVDWINKVFLAKASSPSNTPATGT